MKTRLVAFVVALTCTAVASATEPLAIFGRQDFRRVTTGSAPADRTQAAFWKAFRHDRMVGTRFEVRLALVNPPEWGKTVSPRTSGTEQLHPAFPGGLVCRLTLHDLQPNHGYILTLNGNPKLEGNALLPTPVPGNEAEKYYDFLDIVTDAQGRYERDLGVFLKPGSYQVRLYVKDTADFKIVLYHDYAPFVVE